jgi:hydrogenase maturation protease
MSTPNILVAGIGNIFFGDDAFGVEVVRRVVRRKLPQGVRVVDFGIRGLDLTYSLLDPYDAVILVDAAPRGNPPGTLCVIEPSIGQATDTDVPDTMVDPHSLDPVRVLRMARSMGGTIERVFLVGCEPSPGVLDDDLHMEMSQPVEASIEEAVGLVESLVNRLCSLSPKAKEGHAVSPANERGLPA